MVQVAVIADIHGNLPALQAVSEDLHHVGPDRVIVNGDTINRGPQSRACVAAVRAHNWTVVYGNHEDYAIRRRTPRMPPEWLVPFFAPFQEIAESFSAEEAVYFEHLPRALVLRYEGLPPVRIAHGSPRALNYGVGPWLEHEELHALLDMITEPVLVGAHTHRAFQYTLPDERLALNCGAVGVPYNGDTRAQYLLLHGENGTWWPEFRAVSYDIQRVYDAYVEKDAFRHTVNQVFMYEIETATFHLRPYLTYCRERALDPNVSVNFHRYRDEVGQYTPRGRVLTPPAVHQTTKA
jgi:predicted phosphodiesterase